MSSSQQIQTRTPGGAGGQAPLRTTAIRRAQPQITATTTPKVLRIGLIQGGKITEERIIRNRETVTVGQSEKNTFIIPHPKLPAKYSLFEMKGGKYYLNVRDFMDGKISSPQGVQDLSVSRGAKVIPLDESSRGKIIIGDTTLLFQFVIPPPIQPAPQLPAALRGGWFKSFIEEWFFNTLVLISLLFHVVPLIYLVTKDWPVEQKGFDLDNKFLQLVLQAPEEDILQKMKGEKPQGERGEAAEEQKTEDTGQVASSESKSKGPKRELTEEEKAALEAQRRARLEAQVSKSGLLAVLGSAGGETSGQAGADLLRAGSVDTDIDGVLKTVQGVRTAGAGDIGGGLRAPAGSEGGGKVADIGAIRVSQADANLSTAGPEERTVKGKADMGKGDEVGGTGILDAGEVNRVVKSRLAAIKMCYEKALRQNPTLEGKISVRFTIGTSGRVTKASVESNTIGNPEVADCVISKVKSFAFSKPEGGEVEYIFPFVFKPSG